MPIFDDFARTHLGPMYEGESMFLFLNRSARPAMETTRLTIEEWLTEYPPEHQKSLIGQFCSKDNNQHSSAYFEIFLHKLLKHLGFFLTIHPEIRNSSRHPDFLVESEEGSHFYVEARVVSGASAGEISQDKRWGYVLKCIDEMDSPNYYLVIRPQSFSGLQPKKSDIKEIVGEAIRNLKHLSYESLCIGGCRFELRGIPRGDSRGNPSMGAIGSVAWGFGFPDPKTALKRAIKGKGSRYGKLDTSYLLAIDILDGFASPADLFNVLYGSAPEEDRFPRDGSRLGLSFRKADGILKNHSTISAVVAFHQVKPSYIPGNWPIPQAYICPNPWARYPMPEPLPRLPRFELVDDRFVPVAGDPLKEILGLPPNWPDE